MNNIKCMVIDNNNLKCNCGCPMCKHYKRKFIKLCIVGDLKAAKLLWDESKNHIYFVVDYCLGGEFFNVLQKMPNKCLSEETAKFYAAEIILALEYLHMKGHVHRDLKPENILLHETGHIQLTDFDLSKSSSTPTILEIVREMFSKDIKKVGIVPNIIANSFVGTPSYIAPEILKGRGYSSSVDWWALGILLYEMLCGQSLFIGDNNNEIFENIKRMTTNKIKFPKNIKLSKEAKSLIRSLLVPDVKKRLGSQNGAADIKEHPFFQKIHWALLRETKPPIVPRYINFDTLDNLDTLETDVGINEKRCIVNAREKNQKKEEIEKKVNTRDPFERFNLSVF